MSVLGLLPPLACSVQLVKSSQSDKPHVLCAIWRAI
jgi:hypothetical protein